MRKLYFLLLSFFFLFSKSDAQDFSNKGKDFWVGYGYHQVMTAGNQQQMVLYFAADQNSNVNVSIPSLGYTQNYFVPAGSVVTSSPIPKLAPQDARLTSEGYSPHGIHITSDKAIVAYAHIYNSNVSGATILFPTNTLGKEYYSINYTNVSNTGNANCWFYVIATDTGTTTVEITPSANTVGGWTAGTTYTITMTQGQIYNVMGTYSGSSGVDLTGSVVKSVNTGSGCKKIGVFSGSGRIAIVCNGGPTSSDNYMVQAAPKAAWGKKYLTVPTAANMSQGFYRICVADPTTVVTVNGAPIAVPLQNNFYYQLGPTNSAYSIVADKPIMVAQYITSQGACGNGSPGDPEVIYLSAVEQNINRVLWNATSNFAIAQHYINIVIPNTGTALTSFTLDGTPIPPGAFQPHPGDPAYSFLTTAVLAGQHSIQSDSGFNAIAYGYGNFESYGYNAGTNIKDLFQFINIRNPLGTVNFPATCRNTPFRLSIVFPYVPTQIDWIFGAPLNAMGFNDTTLLNPTPDSSWVVAGRTIYRFQLPRTYTITAVGTYPIKVVATNPTPDGCGNLQEIDFDLEVFEPPVADFTFTTNGCFNSPVNFFDNSNTGGRPVISRFWNFGDANTSTINNPTHTYAAPGSYLVKYTLVTDVGCLADTVDHIVNLDPLPTALFTATGPFCINQPITFTDQSTAGGSSTIQEWVWDFGDGSPPVTVIAPNPPGQTHNYATAGTYNVTLRVETATGCQSILFTLPVTIHPNPVSDFTLPVICLPAGTANFTDMSTVPPPGTIAAWAWDFGDGGTSTLQNPTHNYTGVGPYNVSLTVTSGAGCIDAEIKVLSTVFAEPQAAFTYPPQVCLGNSASFTDNSTAPGSTVTQWAWDFGDGNTSTVQNPTHTYTAAGTYTVTLNVTSAEGCQTVGNFAQHQVEVLPLPTATIAGNTSVCLNATSPNVTFTGANGTAPYTFTYNINGGPNQVVTTVSGNSVDVPVPTNVAGTFIYTLVSVQEGSGVACSQPQTGSVTVTVNVLPTATIAGTTTVCRNAPSPNITFTGFNGTAPYTFTYNINGGPPQTITTSSGNSVTIAVPTNVAGTFVYNLVNVQEGSGLACQQSQTGSATVIVNELPTATIAGTTEVCLNAPSPNITFTGAGTTAPYTFTYNINGGPNQIVTTVSGNSVTVAVPTNVAGTFVYNLLSVSDGTPEVCGQNQTGSATVIVNQLPTANFSASTPSCESTLITFTDLSTPNSGTIISWAWDFGDGNTSTLQNPTHTYTTPGTYTVSLVVTTDKGCASTNPPQQITVYGKPTADFLVPEVCLSDTWAQFTDLSTATAPDVVTAWAWDFGDGGTSTLQNPQHSYLAVGSYNVTLTVTTNRGCTDVITQTLFVNGSFPVADFTIQNPAGLCANDSVAIVEASTVFPGTITKVEIYWDNVGAPGTFDTDNTPVTGEVYKHKYPTLTTTQTYTIRYRAYSGGVCVNDRFRDVTVNAAPDVVFNAMQNICYDAAPWQIPPAIASEIGGVPGTGVFSGPGVSPSGLFTPSAAGVGTHRIRYTFTSNAGCVDTASNLITVWDTATARIDVQPLICERSPALFNSSNSSIPPGNGTITGWNWNFGDPASGAQNTSTLAAPTHLFTGWGAYTVTLSVLTSNGCRSTVSTLPVTVNPLARPNFTFPAVSCLPNATVQFTNSSMMPDGTPMSYFWDFGDPPSGAVNNSTGTNPSHTYIGTGPYNVNLEVTSNVGCVHDTTIVLNSIHPAPQASFTTDKVDVCIGGSITFTNTSNPADGTLQSLNWDLDNGVTRTVPSFTYTYPVAGTYDVTLFITNSWNCRSNTFTQTVSVNPYPTVDAGPSKFMLEGGQVQLTPVVNVSYPVTYSWSPGIYLNDSTLASPVARPPSDMYFRLTVTSDKGCSAWDTVFVKVLKKPDIPNIFSPNGDGVNDRWVIAYLDSYPGCIVEVVNRYGQLVYRSVGYATPWDGKVNGKDVPVGTYYYVVSPKNGRAPITGYVDIIR